MLASDVQLNLIEILRELSEIPFCESDQTGALTAITKLASRALGSQLCNITFVDVRNRRVYQAACVGLDDVFERRSGNKRGLWEVPRSRYLDFDLIEKGKMIEKYGLTEDGQGIANPKTAQRFGLSRMIAYPMWSDGRLLGYINHFSSGTGLFTASDKNLLEIFGRHAVVSIERLRQQSSEHTLPILNDVCRSLASLAPGYFLQRVAQGVCKLLDVSTCVVWEHDEGKRELRVAATTPDVDEEYRNMSLNPKDPHVQERLAGRQAVQIEDVTSLDAKYFGKDEAKRRGWVSLLTVPIYVDNRLTGMLDVYTKSPRHFKEWEKEAFALFANQTALSLHLLEGRVEELNRIVQEVTEAHDENALFDITLRRALELVGRTRGWISRLNVRTGELEIVAQQGHPTVRAPLKLGQGITGRALQEEEPWRVDDVRKSPYYEEFWPDTRSELAIPLVILNAEVRVGREIQHGSKRIGVLNVESRTIGAFFNLDEDRLLTLARAAAIAYERLETDRKIASLSRIETEIFQKEDFDLTMKHILRAITESLGYQFVNISLVDEDANRIRTHYLAGLNKEEAARFRKLADHPLESPNPDIQADIVKSREIEVPGENDPRFDQGIYDEFGHRDLIRVFVPMISRSGNRVVGTVEAGYKRNVRPYIYERDVKILTDFVAFVTVALEQRREEVIQRIMHEFRAPAAAIRSNVSYLRNRFRDLPERKIQNKLDDLALDTELVLLQVSKVEHFLGGAPPVSNPQRTVVYRDIIVKTINQLKPRIVESGFDASKVHYNDEDIGKMVLYLDPVKLNQVVFNLLINSIKYAEDDPTKFSIRIDVDETRDLFIVKFKDWGIGIKPEFAESIFEQGFRAPEAKTRFVTGSGLGLTIARRVMRELGGDLKLANNYKPTEFHVILPKTLKELPR